MILANKKIINAWCMYDWANSVYSLVITTAIFPAYYEEFAKSVDGSPIIDFFGMQIQNTVLYSYSISISFLIVALLLPFLSGIADFLNNKKLFMKIFMYLGASACISLYFFDGRNVELGIIASMVASIGFSGSLVFYDAFLPELANGNDADKISARGYSMGYIGSVILLISILFISQNYELFGISTGQKSIQISFVMVGIWWLGFSQITFYFLKEKSKKFEMKDISYLFAGYKELRKVWKRLQSLKEIRLFLYSYFFYNTGVQTIIALATIFAAEVLKMETSKLILTILIIQIVAILGSILFSRVTGRYGNKKSISIMLVIWMVVCCLAYYVQTDYHFYAVAFLVGLVLGGIQSQSRSTFSNMIPKDSEDHASFFSFYEVTYYLSVVFGTFSFGLAIQLTENMRNNAILLGSFFLLGLVILFFVPSSKLDQGKYQ